MGQREMRNTECQDSGVSLVNPGRSPAGPCADVFLCRGRAGDGAECLVTFDRKTVILARKLAGLDCRIRLPLARYVAVGITDQPGRHVVSLLHRDLGLSVDLAEFPTLAAAQDYCDQLTDFTGLPEILLGGLGSSSESSADLPQPRPRRKRLTRGGRPRFLHRREVGAAASTAKLAGDEIIARS